jgi:hypothetical protein
MVWKEARRMVYEGVQDADSTYLSILRHEVKLLLRNASRGDNGLAGYSEG